MTGPRMWGVAIALLLGRMPAAHAQYYPGFGAGTSGGYGYSTHTVTNSNDRGSGSLRAALLRASSAGGGNITFQGTGRYDIYPRSDLEIPTNTTLDSGSARVNIWGDSPASISTDHGLLNIWSSNVIVKNVGVRDSPYKGIYINPHHGADIANIVLYDVSVTGNLDEGINITGSNFTGPPFTGHTVSNVLVLSSAVFGNGGDSTSRGCSKGLCGGGALVKYGAYNVSFYANTFLCNVERTPLISGYGYTGNLIADVQFNFSGYTESSSMSSRDGAYVNFDNNWLQGDSTWTWPTSYAWFGPGDSPSCDTPANSEGNPNAPSSDHLSTELSIPAAPPECNWGMITVLYAGVSHGCTGGANTCSAGQDPIDNCSEGCVSYSNGATSFVSRESICNAR